MSGSGGGSGAARWLSDGAVERLRAAAERPDLSGTKYRLVDPIAHGGMGTIWLAIDGDLEREVALKVLSLPDPGPDPAHRLLREARILAGLEHPGIVPVHDVGTLPDGRLFYVMKRVRGASLDRHPVRRAPLGERLRVMGRICEAVAFAHAHGVIHRDLKPANVMVGAFGEVLVMDWGIARVADGAWTRRPSGGAGGAEGAPGDPGSDPGGDQPSGTEPALDRIGSDAGGPKGATQATAPGVILGTPAWMAPEQARGGTESLDERTDVHALGAILFFLLTGEPPSRAETPAESLTYFEAGGPPSPRRRNPSVPRPLDAVCRRAMAPDPRDRFAGAAELGRELDLYLEGLPPESYREGPLERAGRWARKYRTAILLVAAYLVMRVALILWTGR